MPALSDNYQASKLEQKRKNGRTKGRRIDRAWHHRQVMYKFLIWVSWFFHKSSNFYVGLHPKLIRTISPFFSLKSHRVLKEQPFYYTCDKWNKMKQQPNRKTQPGTRWTDNFYWWRQVYYRTYSLLEKRKWWQLCLSQILTQPVRRKKENNEEGRKEMRERRNWQQRDPLWFIIKKGGHSS